MTANRAWDTERVVDRHLNGRRQTKHGQLAPDQISALAADHPAVTEARTLFPSRVTALAARVLIPGNNSRKLGAAVLVGAWKGMPIHTLTLEERATCPRDCELFNGCYGNAMRWPWRMEAGPILEARLDEELWALQLRNPDGFVVRPHILGDFYSVAYVDLWARWLKRYPALRVFGYTHRKVETDIGAAVIALRERQWARFAMRSSSPASMSTGATVIDYVPTMPRVPEGIVCPIQTGKRASCGSCGLCWAAEAKAECIVFVRHGVTKFRGPRSKPAAAAASV